MVIIMFDSVINLLSEKIYQDKIGQIKKEYKKREVFASKKSISQKEYFSNKNKAPFTGIRGAFCFEVNVLDYENEDILEYNRKEYKIYRVYEKGEYIELYCEERGGITVENQH